MEFLKKLFKVEEAVVKWEPIDDDSDRLKVPGGWIVRSRLYINDNINGLAAASVHQIFIHDIAHEWEIENKDKIEKS